MSDGQLKLRFRDDGDGTGKLLVEAESNGFSGKSDAYFDRSQVQNFARAIGEFPLPDCGRCTIASGFGSKDAPGKLEQEHVGIEVYPIDNRGHIGIQVRLATEIWPDTRLKSQRAAKVEVITTYQSLSYFSRDLLALMEGVVTEAVLRGETLQ